MGNELRKDDAIALMIAGDLGAIKGFSHPENFIKEGEEIILIDAVDFNALPGSVKSFLPDEINEFALGTTHNMDLGVLKKICKIKMIIGIQPKDVGYGKGLSKELLLAKKKIIDDVKTLLGN